jgi:hypothetical protein
MSSMAGIIGGRQLAGNVAYHWLPTQNNTFDLGNSTFRWDDVFATNGTIDTSDERLKKNITDLSLGLDFVNDLRPVVYEWKKDRSNIETSLGGKKKINQKHYGIIAQEVMEVLKNYGITSVNDFGGLHRIGTGDEDYYGARYGEFVAILIKAIQELSAKVKALEDEG